MYKLTIISVVLNNAIGIKETIDSILPHINNTIELLIIDGGSSDGTIDILKRYTIYQNYRFISEPDTGIYNAMNKGVILAKGEWAIFINCGDKLLKVPTFPNKDCDLFCCSVETELGHIKPTLSQKLYLYNTLPHQGIFYKKDKFNGFDESLHIFADYDYNLNLYKHGAQIVLGQETVAFHSLNGVSNNASASVKKELFYVIKKNTNIFWLLIAYCRFKYQGLIWKIKQLKRF